MSRSSWKGYFINSVFFKQKQKKILIWSKNTTITGNLKGQTVFVYNGKEFKKVFITGAKIGFKFGEFVFKRTYTQKYKAVNKKKK